MEITGPSERSGGVGAPDIESANAVLATPMHPKAITRTAIVAFASLVCCFMIANLYFCADASSDMGESVFSAL
jgi:hypothetical protein